MGTSGKFITVVALALAAIVLLRSLPNRIPAQVARRSRASELAQALAAALLDGRELTAGHPYYGGMGFRFGQGAFIFGAITDGYICLPSEARAESYTDADRIEFRDRASFEGWVTERLCEDSYPHRHPWLSIQALEAVL